MPASLPFQPDGSPRIERVYFDNSALHYFLQRSDYHVVLGTRELQARVGRELLVSPVSLWEIALTPDPRARDFLLFTTQHLFSSRLLASPAEILFRYMAHAYPENRVNYEVFTSSHIGETWRRMASDPSVTELERMLVESGLGGPDDVRRAAQESQGLGLFVRSLVGMDRSAAKEAMASFLAGKSLSANQIEFVNLVVDHLTEHGVVAPDRLSSRRSRISRPADRRDCSAPISSMDSCAHWTQCERRL